MGRARGEVESVDVGKRELLPIKPAGQQHSLSVSVLPGTAPSRDTPALDMLFHMLHLKERLPRNIKIK